MPEEVFMKYTKDSRTVTPAPGKPGTVSDTAMRDNQDNRKIFLVRRRR